MPILAQLFLFVHFLHKKLEITIVKKNILLYNFLKKYIITER